MSTVIYASGERGLICVFVGEFILPRWRGKHFDQ